VRKSALLIVLVAFFLAGNTIGIYTTLTSQKKLLVWDLQPLWQAGRWMIEGRGSPYSDELTRLLQLQSYGRPAQGDEDNRAFVYPLYILFPLLPLALLPMPWAQAAWFTALELAVVIGAVGALRAAGWELSARRALLATIGAFVFYPMTWALLLGQVSLPVFALMMATLLALRAKRDGWAGTCLALTTAKPQMVFLLAPTLLLWAVAQCRHRFLVSFAAALGALMLASFAACPSWLMDAWQAATSYYETQPFPPPVALLAEAFTKQQAEAMTLGLIVLLLGGLVWTWWRERRAQPLPMWAISFTLVITTLIAPRTSLVNQVMLLLPLVVVLHDLSMRGAWGKGIGAGLALATAACMWGIRAAGVIPSDPLGYRVEHIILSPILPTALFLVMLALRLTSRGETK